MSIAQLLGLEPKLMCGMKIGCVNSKVALRFSL